MLLIMRYHHWGRGRDIKVRRQRTFIVFSENKSAVSEEGGKGGGRGGDGEGGRGGGGRGEPLRCDETESWSGWEDRPGSTKNGPFISRWLCRIVRCSQPRGYHRRREADIFCIGTRELTTKCWEHVDAEVRVYLTFRQKQRI